MMNEASKIPDVKKDEIEKYSDNGKWWENSYLWFLSLLPNNFRNWQIEYSYTYINNYILKRKYTLQSIYSSKPQINNW